MPTNRLLHASDLERVQPHGEMLATFLNSAKDDVTQSHAVGIFELCHQLDSLRKSKPPFPFPQKPTAAVTEYVNKRYDLLKAVNQALSKYHFHPHLVGHDPYQVNWMVAEPTGQEIKNPAQAIGDSILIPPISAINIILEMTANGTLDRVRQCICGRWFFAATNKKVVCSDACRFEKYKQKDNDAFKKNRADYMRTYYRNPKVQTKRKKPNGPTKKTK
jgi:hypothetical protein